MIIGQIKDGIVLDHITAGKAMDIYNVLKLSDLDCSVALIKNASSEKLGKKDIIKIDEAIDMDFNVIGYAAPGVTVNIIKDGKLADKRSIAMPETMTNVIRCKNPRCITVSETQLDAIFLLSDAEQHTYRCAYCEAALDDKKKK